MSMSMYINISTGAENILSLKWLLLKEYKGKKSVLYWLD